jgi:hypothetical protein
MSIRWNCSHCEQSLAVSEQQAGRAVRCPKCSQILTAPLRSNNSPPLRPPAARVDVGSAPSPAAALGMRLAIVAGFVLFLAVGAVLALVVFFDYLSPFATRSRSQAAVVNPPATTTPDISRSTTQPQPTPVRDPQLDLPTSPKPDPRPDPITPTPDTKLIPVHDPIPPAPPPLPPKDPENPIGPHSLSVASIGEVIVVSDRLTGKEVWRQTASAPVQFLAFGENGKTVISRDAKNETCYWDAVTGKLLSRQLAIPAPVTPGSTPVKSPDPDFSKLPKTSDAEELRAGLLKVKEIDFSPVIEKMRDDAISASITGQDFAKDQQLRQQFKDMSPPVFLATINNMLLKKAVEEGLPLLSQQYGQLAPDAAKTMNTMSKELRRRGFVSIPGAAPNVALIPRGTPVKNADSVQATAHAAELQKWCDDNHIENYAGALTTFQQMLQVEHSPTRMVMIDEVAKCDTPEATRILVARAVFDTSPKVRQAAVELLRKRKPEAYRPVLMSIFRYPWAPAADHAAAAIVSLDDKPAIPDLVALLDKPDPLRAVYDDKRQTGVVHELVRINHMRNCFLCHAVSTKPSDLVRGAVPHVGQPLPPMYYESHRGDFVQATGTFLLQDFSICQPVENPAPWPSMQRYDYLVRTRKATPEEMAELKNSPPATYPQRDAVLTTLRQLSGRDLGDSTDAWKKYAAEIAPAKAPADKNDAPADPNKPAASPKP